MLESGDVLGVVDSLEGKEGSCLVVVEDDVGEELLLLRGEFSDHVG